MYDVAVTALASTPSHLNSFPRQPAQNLRIENLGVCASLHCRHFLFFQNLAPMARSPAVFVLVLACCACAFAQTSVVNSNSQANATTTAYNGYNATGFMNTNAYYGSYLATNTTGGAGGQGVGTPPEGNKPNVSISVQPEGCTILSRQFGIANYSGDLPCTLAGATPSDNKPACVVGARFCQDMHDLGLEVFTRKSLCLH